jgi:hypothetical protein
MSKSHEAFLLNLSNTIKITSFPSDLGKPSIKSILILMNTACGIRRGYNNPRVNTFSLLFF